MVKEVNKRSKHFIKNNVYFTIISSIKAKNRLPTKKECAKSKQALHRYVKNLVKDDIIKKAGYGTWDLINESKFSKLYVPVKTSKVLTTQYTFNNPENRGHAFAMKIELPKIPNWHKREKYMQINNIEFEKLNIFGNGQRIFYQGKKIWVTDKSIIIFCKSDYLADTGLQSHNLAVANLLSIALKLEVVFNTRLRMAYGFKWKVTRQHQARMKNILAKQQRMDGKRLEIRDEKGVWLITDFSLSVDELEGIRPETAHKDIDAIATNVNYMKDKPDLLQYHEKRLKAVEDAVIAMANPQLPEESKEINKKLPSYIG